MIFTAIIYLIIANGIYDILCATSILKITDIPVLNNLHLSMFLSNQSPIFERFLAYYLFVNGVIRVFGGMTLYQSMAAKIVALSYFLEATFFANELYREHSVNKDKGVFVIAFSLLLCGLSMYHLF